MKKKRRLKKKPFIVLFSIIILLIICIMIPKGSSKVESIQKDLKEDVEKKEEIIEEKQKKLSIVMVGDVLIHESVYLDAKTDNGYDFSKMFTDIEPIIKDYDLKYCNQESIIGGKNLGISGYPNFNAPDEIGDNLVDMGFNLVSLANNHAYDKGEKAILYSVDYWKNKKGVVTAGSYSSSEERNEPKIYEMNGIKYAFLSYTTSLNGNKAKDYLVNMYDKDQVKDDIEKVSSADLIIVAMHWGNEYTNEPTNSQREIAEYLSSLGVDLIIGTHPHVVEPITYIGDTLVIYSLGNFISNQLVIDLNPAIGLLLGLDITIDDDKVKFEIKDKELIYSYSDHSTNFKVIPFKNLSDDILLGYKDIEDNYMKIVDKELK